jgi:hypothetical protein
MHQKNMFDGETKTGGQFSGQTGQTTEEKRPEAFQVDGSGDPIDKKEGVHYYLWTGPGGRVFHLEHMHKPYQPMCNFKLKSPRGTRIEHYFFRTPHKPIGMIFCAKCQAQRGVFDLPHKQEPLFDQ